MQTHVFAGFFGGMASAVALQPLDLLKTRVQQAPAAGIASAVKSLGSIHEAWRGTLPSLIRTSVGASLYMGLLSKFRDIRAAQSASSSSLSFGTARASSILPKLSALDNVLTGAAARSIVGFIMMPITVVKVRFESNHFNYRSIWGAIHDIARGPSGWKQLFSGYGATISRDAPYAGIYMLFYEASKDVLQLGWLPSPLANSAAAVNASILATTLTAPFDTVKTRIQVSVSKLTFPEAWKQITAGGWKSLFDGLSLRLTRKALSAGISWGIYEEIVKVVAKRNILTNETI